MLSAMTFAAFGIHKEIVEEGIDPTSDTYYQEVDKRMRDNFPHKFSEEQSAPVQQVAASSRGASGKKSSRKIKLTPSQVAIAKRLNVPLEEYAKHIVVETAQDKGFSVVTESKDVDNTIELVVEKW